MTPFLFFIAGGIAVLSSLLAITRSNAVHALLYLVTSLLATGVVFFIFGAPFAAVLEVIIYAGAIMVLFVFVIMMLHLRNAKAESPVRHSRLAWTGPTCLTLVLLAEIVYTLLRGADRSLPVASVPPKQVAVLLFGHYALAVELASMLLLAALVAAFHIARRKEPEYTERGQQ